MNRDDGTVLVQAIGGLLLAALVSVAMLDLGSLHLTRTSLSTVAADAALAASTAIDVDALYEQGIGMTLPLDPILATDRALASVMFVSDPRLQDLRVDDVDVVDDAVRVQVSALVETPLRGFGADQYVRLHAAATASVPTRF